MTEFSMPEKEKTRICNKTEGLLSHARTQVVFSVHFRLLLL